MIESLHVENLKGFSNYDIAFDRINLLVGGNNSGKTTLFHAMNIFFWCFSQTADIGETAVTFRKTQVPELGAIPYFNMRDLFHLQKIRAGRLPTKIRVQLKTSVAPILHFSIYPAFSRNLMIDGGKQTVTRQQYSALQQLNPVYVPGTIGITVREELYREVAQERMILDGRQNQVLRNLVYRLRKKEDEWAEFKSMAQPLFSLSGIDVPFDEETDEWLTATYQENGCDFDFVTAGSGFLQVINLLCFLFLHTSRVALLDEPDSHMHDDLQRLTFDLLDRLSRTRNIQLIIATHSPTLIDAAGLEQVLLIDRSFEFPLRAQDVDTLVPLLGDRGLSLPPAKVMNTLKTRRALFVEGKEADYEEFIAEFGELLSPGFKATTRGLTVFETTGASKRWPFDSIVYFQQLLRVDLKYTFVSDRDFLTDDELVERVSLAAGEAKSMAQLERRHRESYILEVAPLARVLEAKWRRKHANESFPTDLSESGLLAFILAEAKKLEDETRTNLSVDPDHAKKVRGDHAHMQVEMQKLTSYFRTAYSDPLAKGEIPYKLLDAKAVLRALRTWVGESHRISFADKEVVHEFNPDEVPHDLKSAIKRVLDLFPDRPRTAAQSGNLFDQPGIGT